MQFEYIASHPPRMKKHADRILLSVIYSEEELRSFGIKDDAIDFNELYIGRDEFYKLQQLWRDPLYLDEFYDQNLIYFKDPYWTGVSKTDFVYNVIISSYAIFKAIKDALHNNTMEDLFKPLSEDDEKNNDYERVKVKSKFGNILGRFAFRIYAIKIEDGVYAITGGTIKIVKEMHEAPNTHIELRKLAKVYSCLDGVNDKESFVEFIFT